MNDLYKEHELHSEYEPNCSTCFSENLMIKTSFDKISRLRKIREEMEISRNHFTDRQLSPNPLEK